MLVGSAELLLGKDSTLPEVVRKVTPRLARTAQMSSLGKLFARL